MSRTKGGGNILGRAGECHPRAEIELGRQLLGDALLRAFAQDRQACRDLLLNALEDANDIRNPFHGPQIAGVNQVELFAVLRIGGPVGGMEPVDVDEIVNHPWRIRKIEPLHGLVTQPVGNGGQAIRLNHGMTGQVPELSVTADERDVGSMQGGHEFHAMGLNDLLREERGHRVGNGVVGVEDVDTELLGDAGQFVRQRQVNGRIPEERIVRHLEGMIDHPRIFMQPVRPPAGCQMHLMAALSVGRGQLGGHDSRTALGGVAGNGDLHEVLLDEC